MRTHPAGTPPEDVFFPRFGLLPDIAEAVNEDVDDRWRETLLPCQPPPELAPLHDERLYARLWRRLLAIVRNPVRVARVGDERWIHMLDTAVIAITPDGTCRVGTWEAELLGRCRLKPLDPWTVAVQGMPWRDLWLQTLAPRVDLEVVGYAHARAGMNLDDAQAWTDWALGTFRRQLPRWLVLRLLRREIPDALALDPWALKVAARLPRSAMPGSAMPLGAYNRVLRHRAAFEALMADAPALVPVFGALLDAPGFPSGGEPLARLRQYLRDQGLSPRAWRLVAHADGRLLVPLSRFYQGDVAAAAVEHLRVLDRLKIRRQPPRWFVERLLTALGAAPDRVGDHVDEMGHAMTVWPHLGRVAPLAATPTQELIADVDLVLRWVVAEGRNIELDERQRRAGWRWLVRQARRWDGERRGRSTLDPQPWPVPFDRQAIDGWEFIALDSEVRLWEEGQAMRHCALDYADHCRESTTLMVSLRRDGRRLATIELQAQPGVGWRVGEVRGFANVKVKSTTFQAAIALAAWLSSAAPPAMVQAPPPDHELADEPWLDLGEADDDDDEDDDRDARRAAAEQHFLDRVVAGVLDDHSGIVLRKLTPSLERWLEHRNDECALSYKHGGPIVFEHQLQDWTHDLDRWIDHLHEYGEIDDRRHARLQRSPRPLGLLNEGERELIQQAFVNDVLGGDADADRYAHWGAEPVTDVHGRQAWVVYCITGYSFTIVQVRYLGATSSLEAVRELLDGMGRFAGVR